MLGLGCAGLIGMGWWADHQTAVLIGWLLTVVLALLATYSQHRLHRISRELQLSLAQQRERQRVALQTVELNSRSRSHFVAMMSHEIRTPLSGILGMTQLLSQTEMNPQQREHLELVRRCGRHLLTVVNDILELARIESGRLHIDHVPLVLRDVVDDVCRLLGDSAQRKGLRLHYDIAHDLPTTVLGDPSRLQQVLHNLIGNAIKFTQRGEVHLQLLCQVDRGQGARLVFQVRDTGPGLAADQIERIFVPFERLHSEQGQSEGSGLGLTIARELVHAMGGQLSCRSEVGMGSTFSVHLPLAPAHMVRSDPATPTATVRAKLPRLQGTVLLVDDNPVNLLVACSALERCGLQVLQATNGLQALQMLQERRFDLVLMDCVMPQLDGFETTRLWREREQAEGLARTPVVALTASAVNGDRGRCLEAGMDDYLVKPFELEELMRLVERHLPPQAQVTVPGQLLSVSVQRG
ncbi:ATP-binding protein [Roseateles sp. BYS180W]|uniref:histidine kinase n=1 Tax=Roseateles rivi TaxID=3299028 RepID=A0ABW7FZL5_9BURK